MKKIIRYIVIFIYLIVMGTLIISSIVEAINIARIEGYALQDFLVDIFFIIVVTIFGIYLILYKK